LDKIRQSTVVEKETWMQTPWIIMTSPTTKEQNQHHRLLSPTIECTLLNTCLLTQPSSAATCTAHRPISVWPFLGHQRRKITSISAYMSSVVDNYLIATFQRSGASSKTRRTTRIPPTAAGRRRCIWQPTKGTSSAYPCSSGLALTPTPPTLTGLRCFRWL